MRKFSIVAAAVAMLVLPSTAQAKGPLLNLGAVCDSLLVLVDHARVAGFSVNQCQTGNFVGVIGRVSGTEGRSIVGSIQMVGTKRPYLIQISYPLVDGGTWSLYTTSHGYKAKLYQQGTYTVIK
ncbi:MAG TPA: hypothetical protein VHU23_12575 [Rhizomicrobium sp.]|jgi:hypothetical protein|nr:hypothetical protein [Rhizomicrobium sp.]